MQTTLCPRCGKLVLHSRGEPPPYCDGVSCGHNFAPLVQERTLPARDGDAPEPALSAVPELPPPPVVGSPQLVAPHRCPKCQGQIHQPACQRWKTITHECGNRTDLLAVIFRAPCCGAFVELPRALSRQTHRCPACPRSFVGPRDDLIHRGAGDVGSGEVMRFRCSNPECHRRLQCNTHQGGEPAVGQAVVCPACVHVITIPSGGRAVGR
ncbi:MAG: hypothetical protein ACRC33_13835 [Gemmataceae bacterium]